MKKKRRSRAKVQRLRFFGPDGKPYERHPKTEDNIAELLPLPHAQRAEQAPFALTETLVYLIRRADSKSGPYYDALCAEISKRLVGQAEYYTRELPEPKASDIVMKVQSDFERILFAEHGSARTDFLEVAFALAVKKRTLQLVNLYLSSPWTQQSKAAADDEESDRELQGIPEKGPGPEGALLDKEEQALGMEMCKTALGAIQNPLLREAARLYWIDGWPVVSKIRGEDDLVGYLRKSEAQIRRGLKQAMQEMRAALGVGVTQ